MLIQLCNLLAATAFFLVPNKAVSQIKMDVYAYINFNEKKYAYSFHIHLWRDFFLPKKYNEILQLEVIQNESKISQTC